MYVAMHFAAAAQVLLLFRVQGSGFRDQSCSATFCSINLSRNPKALHYIQNQEPEILKTLAKVCVTDP
jgi:hypothetical protein